MKKSRKTSLLVSASAVAGLAMGAGIAMAAHPPIPLYTYEEVATQMNGPSDPQNPFSAPVAQMPVMVDATKKQGFPYSPKQTCSGAGNASCHNYSNISKHAYHATLGFNEWMDNDPSGLFISPDTHVVNGATINAGVQTGLNPQKPWLQSHGHNGKW